MLERGQDPSTDALWTLGEVQLLLDLWVITQWQTAPQSGLRVPGMPRRSLSPNQMYLALSATAPHVPVQLSRDDYIALLPLAWRSIQPYGVNFGGLTYDADELHPMRGRKSGVGGEARGRWEVRYDPYNLRQLWVRDHVGAHWITATWSLAPHVTQPFSHEVLRAAQRALADTGTASSIDVLEQINRIQTQRAPLSRPKASRPRRARVALDAGPGLRILEPPDAVVDVPARIPAPLPVFPAARLEILD